MGLNVGFDALHTMDSIYKHFRRTVTDKLRGQCSVSWQRRKVLSASFELILKMFLYGNRQRLTDLVS